MGVLYQYELLILILIPVLSVFPLFVVMISVLAIRRAFFKNIETGRESRYGDSVQVKKRANQLSRKLAAPNKMVVIKTKNGIRKWIHPYLLKSTPAEVKKLPAIISAQQTNSIERMFLNRAPALLHGLSADDLTRLNPNIVKILIDCYQASDGTNDGRVILRDGVPVGYPIPRPETEIFIRELSLTEATKLLESSMV